MEGVGGIAITSLLVGLSGAVMPGPVLTITISETALRLRAETPATTGYARVRGALAGPLIVLGHAILEVVLAGFLTTLSNPYWRTPPLGVIPR